MPEPMTPEQFKQEMEKIADQHGGDLEIMHAEMDELMIKVLLALGYHEGAQVFLDQDKWYA